LFSIAAAFGTGAGGVASRVTGVGVGVLASVTLAAIGETFAVVGADVETEAMSFGARAFLTSLVELMGGFFCSGVADEDISAALFAAGDLWFLILFSFTEFIFMFT
jgi:hypothetical protein